MSFNAEQFCIDHNIDFPNRSNKHSRPGWVQIHCPFCTGHEGWHGGFNIEAGYYNCWRCGHTWLPKVIVTLLNTSYPNANQIVARYSDQPILTRRKTRFQTRRITKLKPPPGTSHIHRDHLLYLRDVRLFKNYARIIRDWNLMSTGNFGFYGFRIFAPVMLEGQMVSYQCRATTSQQSPPYLACSEEDEIIHHKHTLYGFDKAIPKRMCVAVEGITDVWRLGPGAVGTFGKKLTKQQIQMLANNFEKVFTLQDADTRWDIKGPESLEESIRLLGTDSETVWLRSGDPGKLTDKQARELMGDLGFL